jgi:tetratricopeptide (TPR) repeat protein
LANITLDRQIFGSGYSGTINVPTGLSWTDSLALQSAASSAWQTSVETRRAREALEQIDYGIDETVDAIEQMENALGLRLEAQTQVMEQQAEVLQEIRGAVMNPAKTRAAERIADVTQLLQHERFERALKVSEEAIDADPNNPHGFFAAGWSHVGLENFDEARAMFEEARDASRGDQRSLGSRQAARSAFLCGKVELAYDLIRDARQTAESEDEKAAVAYDVAVYAWTTGDRQSAVDSIDAACRHDSRHAERALVDPAYEQASEIRELAARTIGELAETVASRRGDLKGEICRIRDALPTPPKYPRSYTELGLGVRPESDWNQLRVEIDRNLNAFEQAVEAAVTDSSLQAAIRAFDDTKGRAAELSAKALPELTAAIADHDAAAQRQYELEVQRQEAKQNRDRWAWLVTLRKKVRPQLSRYVWGGIVFTAIGIALPAALVIGIPLLGVAAIATTVGSMAEKEYEARNREIQGLDEQLRV